MEVKGRKLVVVGAGRAGRAAVALALDLGARVTLVDDATEDRLSGPLSELAEELGPAFSRVRLLLGGLTAEALEEADLVIKSPGVPWKGPIEGLRAKGRPVVDEAEFASWFLSARMVAVTGTNGKSTTTALIGHFLRAAGRDVFVGGNIGLPLSRAVGTSAGRSGVVVAELSSFQIEALDRFRAHLALLTNLSPDHLDRHGSLERYFAAKARLFQKQTRDDLAVYNADQPDCSALVSKGPARRLGFSRRAVLEAGASLVEGGRGVLLRDQGRGSGLVGLDGLRLVGAHNKENVLAACLAAWQLGVAPEEMAAALGSFSGLPHRMEHVATVRGVAFYDDSKATNVGSAVGSLSGLEGPVVLLAGGRHKGASYEPLRRVLEGRLRALVLLGEAAPILEEQLGDLAPVVRAGDMDEAVRRAAALARPGDAVVLCPACSSYDMFRDYEERGEAFAAAVRGLVP